VTSPEPGNAALRSQYALRLYSEKVRRGRSQEHLGGGASEVLGLESVTDADGNANEIGRAVSSTEVP